MSVDFTRALEGKGTEACFVRCAVNTSTGRRLKLAQNQRSGGSFCDLDGPGLLFRLRLLSSPLFSSSA